MEKNPIENDKRNASRTRKLGEDAVCILCGLADPTVLEEVAGKYLEDHHIVGQNHDPDATHPICPNCHKKVHIGMMAAGADLETAPHTLDRLVSIMRALGAFFEMLMKACYRWAQEAEDALKRLTGAVPNWREI